MRLSAVKTKHLILSMPLWILFNQWATMILNKSYTSSGYPVPYYVAQLSFSGESIKGYFMHMMGLGTLDVYIRTQWIDFIFIISVALLHGVTAIILYRLLVGMGDRMHKVAGWMIPVVLIAPLADALENAVSFFMLADPIGFPNWLAYVYSSFAAVKFLVFVLSYTWFLFGMAWYLVVIINRRLKGDTSVEEVS